MMLRWFGISLDAVDVTALRTASASGLLDPFAEDRGSGNVLELGEAWHALHHLLTATGAGRVADALLPGEPPGTGDDGVRLLDEKQVRDLADDLRHLDPDDVIAHYDASRFAALGIPPGPWTVASARDVLLPSLRSLNAFFGMAAASGQGAMITVT